MTPGESEWQTRKRRIDTRLCALGWKIMPHKLNPVEYLWAWLKRHALANYCPNSIAELATTARGKLKSAQRRTTLIAAFWKQAELF